MIRLTVLYNLPEGVSEDTFLDWRLSEHQHDNESMPGVLRTDFARITDRWPKNLSPDYRFQTTAEWSDRESFDGGFNEDSVQESLRENLKKLGDYEFIISEVLTKSDS